MLALLGSQPAAPAGAGRGAKGKGKGRGQGKGTTPSAAGGPAAALRRLIPLVADLDRRVGTLEDRSTFVVVVKNEAAKSQISQLRALWREGEKKRRDAFETAKNGGDANARMQDHPMGASLRSCMFKVLVELLDTHIPYDNVLKQRITKLTSMTGKEIDEKLIFRAKPRHPEFKEGRAWVWCFMLNDPFDPTAAAIIKELETIKCEHVFFAPQRSQDGPLLKWLLEWRRGDGVNEDDSYGVRDGPGSKRGRAN
mmetsp:Transcript_73708/g.208757  ORF Transcript_73708/g.208757 Transcript_73708/m.208757 type:complete len:253 (+) Transcript_73708:4749-5507(+)